MVSEIISRVERRRVWPDEAKARIVAEALTPGVTAASVADRNSVSRSQLYTWLGLARQGQLPGIVINARPAAGFVPVQIGPPQPAVALSPPLTVSPAPIAPAQPNRRAALVEIVLANGRIVKVDAAIDPLTLGRLVAALDAGAR